MEKVFSRYKDHVKNSLSSSLGHDNSKKAAKAKKSEEVA